MKFAVEFEQIITLKKTVYIDVTKAEVVQDYGLEGDQKANWKECVADYIDNTNDLHQVGEEKDGWAEHEGEVTYEVITD